MEPANRGVERYSAWFGDSDGRVLYFGLSPFWELWWQSGGDPHTDLAEPGDHLIGRFDLERERFLRPLRVRGLESGSRSSVWDVLAHSNGRVYFTTYFEETGSVAADGSDPRIFSGLGAGFNEIYEGPNGNLYVTRYSDAPRDANAQRYGAVVELTPDGELVREIRFEKRGERFMAPKSVAVDPGTGEIWLNTDTFLADGSVLYEAIRLAPDGRVLNRQAAPPELHFVSFDPEGRGYFAEVSDGQFQLRITRPGGEPVSLPLGPREGADFIQDIKFAPSGVAALAFWSGRVTLVRPRGTGFEHVNLRLELPPQCAAPLGRSLVYTAVPRTAKVYATLFCGARVLSTPIPTDWPPS
jgi:hypothetical protein